MSGVQILPLRPIRPMGNEKDGARVCIEYLAHGFESRLGMRPVDEGFMSPSVLNSPEQGNEEGEPHIGSEGSLEPYGDRSTCTEASTEVLREWSPMNSMQPHHSAPPTRAEPA